MPQILGPWTVLDLAVIVGIALVLPLAFGGPWRGWLGSAAAGAVALAGEPGSPLPIALSVAPVLVAGWLAVVQLLVVGRPATWADGAPLLARVWSLVATASLVAHCAGWNPLGFHEPLIQLTAVHYLYAGVGALVLATRAHQARPSRLAQVSLLVTAVAPPIVALGFITESAIPQVGGALAMSVGVWGTAIVHLRLARDRRVGGSARMLLVVSGVAVWVPMLLAVLWAAAQHWSVPALSIPDMARTHGLVNGFGFVLAGLLATMRVHGGRSWD